MPTSPREPDRELVERTSQGDAAALGVLLERHLPGLRRFLARRAGGVVGARESVSDLAQSVCREVLEDLEGERFEYRGEPEFKQWLYQAALYKVQDRRRYHGAEMRAGGREVAGRAPGSEGSSSRLDFFRTLCTPSQEAMRQEDLDALQRAFERLPERYAAVIRLVHFEGRSHREVAEELEISEANSRVLLARAVARLAKLGRQDR